MRLIDADEFKKYLETGMNALERLWEERVEALLWAEKVTGGVVKAIDAQPVAYDLDGVLERLEKEKNPMYREDGTLMAERTSISIDKAIEIVKGGIRWK